MTISTTVRTAGPFIGNDTASSFPFAFKVFAATDLQVVVLDTTTGAQTTLLLYTDYTVALNLDQNASPGGTVTLVAGPLATGKTMVITSDIPELQQTDLSNQGGFYPSVITDALDKLTALIQQLHDLIGRSVKVPITAALGADGAELFSGALIGTQDGVNTVFQLTNAGVALGRATIQATVWKNFPQVVNQGFTYGPGVDQVTFTSAPAADDILFAQGIY